MNMDDNPHKYPDSTYSLDPAQWKYNQRIRRGRVVGIACAALAGLAFISIVALSGHIVTIIAFILFVLAGLFYSPFISHPICSSCGQKLIIDDVNNRFMVCHQCRRYIWLGTMGDELS
jgi:hypothetical protein